MDQESKITVEELDKMCAEFVEMKDKKAQMQQDIKNFTKDMAELERKIMFTLDTLDKTKNSGEFGSVSIVRPQYFKVVDKELAYGWAKSRGDFEAMATVPAQTMSSYVKQIVNEKRDEGDFAFIPPGVEESTSERAYLRVGKS